MLSVEQKTKKIQVELSLLKILFSSVSNDLFSHSQEAAQSRDTFLLLLLLLLLPSRLFITCCSSHLQSIL